MSDIIPFNRPFMTGNEVVSIERAYDNGVLSGNGAISRECEALLEARTGVRQVLLTHSCTGALEMAAILLDLEAGDEVIMPAFTFVSTANAIVLRGGVPVFCDIRADTLNIDETKIEALITPRTKAICVVHYAGVSCDMDPVLELARHHGLAVIEDAAQGIEASYKGRALGAMGDLGALSFHETKNITCGEGGALLVNREDLMARAEIIHEKGTDRRAFERGEVDKYTWRDTGSSFLLGELVAAFLKAQLDAASLITARRLALWNRYHSAFENLEASEKLRRPVVPPDCLHNAHMYYLLLPRGRDRAKLLSDLRARGIMAVFHYVPLDTAPAAMRFAAPGKPLPVTAECAARLIRLPLWTAMKPQEQDRVIADVCAILSD